MCGANSLPYLEWDFVNRFAGSSQLVGFAHTQRQSGVQWPQGVRERCPEAWVQLIEGLVERNPARRWGLHEVREGGNVLKQ